jgi:hypothetical protein
LIDLDPALTRNENIKLAWRPCTRRIRPSASSQLDETLELAKFAFLQLAEPEMMMLDT